jgi:hypothetical protein
VISGNGSASTSCRLAALADELGIPSEAELLRRQRELSAPDGSL